MAYAGYDVNLGGTDLKLVRGRNDALSIRFLSHPSEPGEPGAIGTIEFRNFHHGIGPEVHLRGGAQVDTYREGNGGFSTLRPGRIENCGTGVTSGGVTDFAQHTSNAGHVRSAFAFEFQGDVYFVLPRQVIKFAAGGTVKDGVFVPGAGNYMRGPAAYYRGDFFIGLENADGEAVGHVHFDTSAGTWNENTLAAHVKGSMFFSVHSLMWVLQTKNYNAEKGQIQWIVRTTNDDDATQDSGWEDITTERSSPFPTSIYPLGQWLLVFGAEAEIIAVSEFPPIKSLLPAGTLPGGDPEFGIGARIWGDQLLIPSTSGLYAMSLSGSGLRNVSPTRVNAGLGKVELRPSALAPFGSNMLVGTREDEDQNQAYLLALSEYPDGTFYNLLRGDFSPEGPMLAIQSHNSGRVYFLVGDATDGQINYMDLPPQTGGPPASVTDGHSFLSAYSDGGSASRKIALQVRMWMESDVDDDVNSGIALGITPDGVSTTFVDWPGPTQRLQAKGLSVGTPSSAVVGRFLSVSLTFYAPVVVDDWHVVLLPIYLDYMEEPEMGQIIEFDVEAGGAALARAGMADDAKQTLYDTLRAMIGAEQTLTMLEGSATFQVVPQRVDAEDSAPATGRERPRSTITVRMRVVG